MKYKAEVAQGNWCTGGNNTIRLTILLDTSLNKQKLKSWVIFLS